MLVREVVKSYTAIRKNGLYPEGPFFGVFPGHYLGTKCYEHLGPCPDVAFCRFPIYFWPLFEYWHLIFRLRFSLILRTPARRVHLLLRLVLPEFAAGRCGRFTNRIENRTLRFLLGTRTHRLNYIRAGTAATADRWDKSVERHRIDKKFQNSHY